MTQISPPLLDAGAASLSAFVVARVLGPAEVHGAAVLLRSAPEDGHLVRLGAAMALWAPLHGHVCADLARIDELVAAQLAAVDAADVESSGLPSLPWPTLGDWLDALRCSSLVRVVDAHDDVPVLDDAPLVLSGTRLYAQRQWVDECVVAGQLRTRASLVSARPLAPGALALLDDLLPRGAGADADPQHRAAAVAAHRGVTIITGGPGTGKTHTIARIVATLLADADERGQRLRLALAAPTGKAAARLREAMDQAADAGFGTSLAGGSLADQLRDVPALTLHRLLGPLPAVRTRFEFDAARPLPFGVVVLDETSMVPLPMMARLLDALRADARLVLVGDPDQLASVDVGAILGDVVAATAAAPQSPLALASVHLQRGHRQQVGSVIGPLSDAIRGGRADEALALVRGGGDVTFLEHSNPLATADGAGVRDVVTDALSACRDAAMAGDADAALRAAASVRVLCAHRRGGFGAEAWNEVLASWMLGRRHPPRHFAGRVLLVTRNDLRHRLSNGDSGVLISDEARLMAAFRVGGEVRTFAPVQLESVDTAFATTVHKSQGSEYDTVVVVLPPPGSPLARRELLYTAVTRATRRVVIVGSVDALVASVVTRSPRASGLVEGLTEGVRSRAEWGGGT